MPLPLHLLRHFHAVVSQQSFTLGAKALHVSQPAVSRAVRELENHAGAPLIERGSGPFQLTQTGATLFARAQEIFAVEQAAEQDLAALASLSAGRLTIGASTTIAEYHLPRFIARFHAAHPGVTLRLVAANSQDIAESLVTLDVDIALVEGPVHDPRLAAIPWREEDMIVIAAPNHPLAGLPSIAPARLATETLVLREPGSGTREVTDAALARLGLVPCKTLEAGSTPAIKQIVAAGLGIAIVPALSAADQLALGRLVALAIPPFPRTLWRLTVPYRRFTHPAAAFDALLEAL